MTTLTTYPTEGRTLDNEIEIDFGSETYNTVPITFQLDTPENFSEKPIVRNDNGRIEFEMEWTVLP